MQCKKTGVSSGTIIHTKTEKQKAIDKKKQSKKNKKAKQCIDCDTNQDGYCVEYKSWCNSARALCPKCIETDKELDYKFHKLQGGPKKHTQNKTKKRRNL